MKFRRILSLKRFRTAGISAEIRTHREMIEEQLIHGGMSPTDAAAAAHRQFGSDAGTLEQSRDEWSFRWLDAFLRDLRFAFRRICSRPLFTATAVLIAGLGVGANTAIVSVLEAVLLKPLGLRDSDRVIVASVRMDKINLKHAAASGVEYRELRAMTDLLSGVAAMEGRSWTFQGGGGPSRLVGRAVTTDFFKIFGERPRLGRFFVSEDRNCLVLSYRFWQSHFSGDAGIIGRIAMLDALPYRIVGVADERFRFPADTEAWSALDLSPDRLSRRGHNMNLTLVGRLRNGWTFAQAVDRVHRYVAGLKSNPSGRELATFGYAIDLEPFARYVAGDLRRPLWLLWAAALVVLFTGCANIAALLLSQTAGRKREMAIRLSLGATRSQIVGQLAVESLLLGGIGGIFGIAVSAASLSFIEGLVIPGKQALQLASLDYRLMLYGLTLSLVSGLIFGLAPAFQLLRNSQTAAMSRGIRHRFQDWFIAAQVAAALVLLVATCLLLRSLWTIEQIRPGFDASDLASAYIISPRNDPGFLDRLESKLRSSAGVEAAALAYPLPFDGGGLTSGFDIRGRQHAPGEAEWHGEAWFVSPGYFGTLRIPLVRGRGFSTSDSMAMPHVCLIDTKLAQQFFPNEDPIGREIAMYGSARIVGIVADVRASALERDSRTTVYYPLAQQSAFPERGVIVRSHVPGGAIIRAAVGETNGSVPVFDIRTMQNRIDESLGIRRVVATLVLVFAAICILLATIGLHGVVTQVVSERAGEIAVRMALGARPSEILLQFLKYGLRSGVAGIACGVVLSLFAQRSLGSLLFNVKPFDVPILCAACAGIALVLSIAIFWPARRASRIHPQTLLRHL